MEADDGSGLGVNRAETAEIFTANQMYIRKFPDRAASLLGKLHCQHYGLPSFGKRLAAATREFVPFSGDPADGSPKTAVLRTSPAKR